MESLNYGPDGLAPAVVQHWRTGENLMLAYVNEESVRLTVSTGLVWFYSRSRRSLWQKGETSGNVLRFVEMRSDCDRDAVLILADPAGPACHTGAASCFFNLEATADGAEPFDFAAVAKLEDIIRDRRENPVEGSYTGYLFASGLDKILKKVGEESAETIIAAKNGSKDELVNESCDLIYHLGVLLSHAGVGWGDLCRRLQERHAVKEEARRN